MGMKNSAATLENSLDVFYKAQYNNIIFSCDLEAVFLGIYLPDVNTRSTKKKKNLHANDITVLFILAKSSEQPRYLQQMNKNQNSAYYLWDFIHSRDI